MKEIDVGANEHAPIEAKTMLPAEKKNAKGMPQVQCLTKVIVCYYQLLHRCGGQNARAFDTKIRSLVLSNRKGKRKVASKIIGRAKGSGKQHMWC